MATEYETVTVEYNDGITEITFDRPERKNALNPTLHREMCEVIHEAKQDARDPEGGTNVVVLTGAGDSFCAGQDLKETFLDYENDPYGAKQVTEMAMEWGRELAHFPSPTIAAVNGYCFGAGVRILCSCDMAIASEEAQFGLSEVNFGIFPAGGSTRVPSRVLDQREFLYLSLSGEDIDADRAYHMHLVNEVVPHADLLDEVAELATTINDLNPLGVRFAKEVYLHELESDMTYDAAIDYELAKIAHLRQLQDQEDMRAIEAFKEKRFRPGFESYDREDIGDRTE